MSASTQIQLQIGAYRELGALLATHRNLTLEMARRELSERYSGQALGVFWAFFHPIFLIGIYIFLFVVVLRVKIGGTYELPLDYTTYLLAGLVPWLGIQEGLNKSCTAITGSASLVKQVVFPIEVLPVRTVLVSSISVFVSLAVLVGYVLLTHGSLHWTYVLLPVLIAIQLLWVIGLAYVFSAASAFVRDTKDVVQVLTLACMYLLPIFYLPSFVPELFRPILYLNPFSYLIWCYQDVIYFGRFEHPWAWLVSPVLGLAFFGLGYRVFRKVKTMLGNVL